MNKADTDLISKQAEAHMENNPNLKVITSKMEDTIIALHLEGVHAEMIRAMCMTFYWCAAKEAVSVNKQVFEALTKDHEA